MGFLCRICNRVERGKKETTDKRNGGRKDGKKRGGERRREIQQMVDLARPLPCSLCKSLSGKSTDPRSISHILRSHNHGQAAKRDAPNGETLLFLLSSVTWEFFTRMRTPLPGGKALEKNELPNLE